MQIKTEEIEQILNNPKLITIEVEICKQIGSEVYRDDLPLLARIYKEEIEDSQIHFGEIERCINEDADNIIRFAVLFLTNENDETEMLSSGIAISYAIYLIYLKERESDLLDYLYRRRIPQHKKLRDTLLSVKEAMRL